MRSLFLNIETITDYHVRNVIKSGLNDFKTTRVNLNLLLRNFFLVHKIFLTPVKNSQVETMSTTCSDKELVNIYKTVLKVQSKIIKAGF